jgi:DNA-binding transcriptional MerR regulator
MKDTPGPCLKTTAFAHELRIPTYSLFNLVRYGVIPAPARDSSGHYVWSPEDQARARAAIEARAHRVRQPKQVPPVAG